MVQELDLNAMVVQFVSAKLDMLVERMMSRLKTKRTEERARLASTYEKYLRKTLESHAMTKSFFHREESVPLYSFYVPLSLDVARKPLRAPGVTDLLNASRRTVVMGTAGSGKSMFMRHLVVDSVRTHTAIPVPVQLRDLDQANDSLVRGITRCLGVRGDPDDATREVRIALGVGLFLLLLDGFDEVELSNQRNLTAQIAALCEEYPETPVVVSSRPDSQFGGWSEFKCATLQGLTMEEACTLAGRLPMDHELRQQFLEDLQSGLYAGYSDMLSNPLLLSMMVLTYGQYADIPDKLATFYGQAYETLFQRHDALKRGYKRERQTDLDMHEFSCVFSAFSLHLYDRRLTRFPRALALECIEKGAALAQVSVDPEAYLDDCLRAVCLLLEDGLEIAFTHRSFQEYFTALYIAGAQLKIRRALIQKYQENANSDDVFPLLYESRPEALEEAYVIPRLAALRREIGASSRIGTAQYARYLAALGVTQVVLHADGNVGFASSRNSSLAEVVCFVEEKVWPRLGLRPQVPQHDWPELVRRARGIGAAETDRECVTIDCPDAAMQPATAEFLREWAGSPLGGAFLECLLETEEVLRARMRKSGLTLNALLER